MEMLQINIERELNSTSTSIVWNMVSTPEGMARWLADTVTLEGDTLTFTWGSPYDHHEMRKATIIEKKEKPLHKVFMERRTGHGDFCGDKNGEEPAHGRVYLTHHRLHRSQRQAVAPRHLGTQLQTAATLKRTVNTNMRQDDGTLF